MPRREEIIDALINIFRNQGVGSDFTISQLAKEVNIGKSTIYEYFKTKEEILESAINRVVDKAILAIKGGTNEVTTFEEMLKEEGHKLLDIAKNSRFLFNFVGPHNQSILSAECKRSIQSKVQELRNFYMTRFAIIFQKGIDEGVLKQELVAENQIIVSSIVIGNIFVIANGRFEQTENVDVEALVNTIYNAIIKLCN